MAPTSRCTSWTVRPRGQPSLAPVAADPLLGAACEESRHPTPGPTGRVVLHVDDQTVLETKALAPLEPPTVGVRPGEGDGDSAVIAQHFIEVKVAIARSQAPCDPGLENLPGLLGAASGRRWAPEAPAPPPTPLHVRVHQANQRLHVTRREGFVCLADFIHGPMVARPPPALAGRRRGRRSRRRSNLPAEDAAAFGTLRNGRNAGTRPRASPRAW